MGWWIPQANRRDPAPATRDQVLGDLARGGDIVDHHVIVGTIVDALAK